MDEDIFDAGVGGADGVLDGVGDFVAAADGEGAVDFEVHVEVVAGAHFADVDFFDAGDAIDGAGDLFPSGEHGGGGFLVGEFGEGFAEEDGGVEEDDDGGAEGGPIVGGLVAFAADESDADAEEGETGGDGVAAVVPGVGFDGGAADLLVLAEDVARHAFLDEDDDGEDPEGVAFREEVGVADFAQGSPGDGGGGADHASGDEGGGEGFGFAVAVGVVAVSGAEGVGEAAEDDEGADNVSERFDGVGDEGEGVAEDAGDGLGNGEGDVDGCPGEGGADAEGEAAGLGGTQRVRPGRWLGCHYFHCRGRGGGVVARATCGTCSHPSRRNHPGQNSNQQSLSI